MGDVLRMNDIVPYSVGATFDYEACWICPLQSKCEGGKFVELLDDVADDTSTIMDSYKEAVGEAVIEPGTDKIVALAEEMVDVLRLAKTRQDETIAAGGVFLKEILDAQNMEPGRFMNLDEIYKPAVEKFIEAPFNDNALDLGTENLDKIAGSIMHYAEVGVCGAIEIERNS